MSGLMTVDLSGVEANIGDFPDGPVEAEIAEASLDVSKKGDPMISLQIRVTHPEYGTAMVKDWLPSTFPSKVAKFVQAFNGLTAEELKQYQNVDLDPTEIKGGRLIVYLGTNEQGYKNIVQPWYTSEVNVDVLPYLNESVL